MGISNQPKPAYSRKFTIVAVGPSRSDEEVREQVEKALADATEELGHGRKIEPKVEPEGGFLGAGVEWSWVYHALPYATTAANLVLTGALTKAGEKLFEAFLAKLPPLNILAKPAPQKKEFAEKNKKPAAKPAKAAAKRPPAKSKKRQAKDKKRRSSRKK